MALRLEAADRGGDQVLVAEDVRLAIGDRILVDGFTTHLTRGELVGLVGPNGAGKSTLLRAITGTRAPDAGSLRVGESILAAYYRQDLGDLPPDRPIFDIIHDLRPHWDRGKVQGHLGRFGFSGDEVQRRVATLSGGERARVALAIIMLSGANLLVFDEPTNHLDVESIEALEDAIEAFDGTVILVSHDRALLRALTTRVWAIEDGRIVDFPGTFDEWEEARLDRQRTAAAAVAAEEAARREHEKRRDRRDDDGARNRRAAIRDAGRALEAAEAAVAALEARVAELSAILEDPDLYATMEGSIRAAAIGAERDETRRDLERAYETWAAATEARDRLGE